MHKAKNIQSFLNRHNRRSEKFLFFCFFIGTLAFISCGDSKSNKEKHQTDVSEVTENVDEPQNSKKTILCFGDSITAGYGLDDTNDAFPGVLQTKVDSLELNYVVVNSGLSGETTAGGRSRISWVIDQEFEVFLLELGANDGLRGVPLSETRANLQAIIDVVRDKNPSAAIILAGMELPPNMGQDYTSEFRKIFSDLAKQNDIAFIPFILKDVGGIASLNQNDGIHPTIAGHKIVANTVWAVLETVID